LLPNAPLLLLSKGDFGLQRRGSTHHPTMPVRNQLAQAARHTQPPDSLVVGGVQLARRPLHFGRSLLGIGGDLAQLAQHVIVCQDPTTLIVVQLSNVVGVTAEHPHVAVRRRLASTSAIAGAHALDGDLRMRGEPRLEYVRTLRRVH